MVKKVLITLKNNTFFSHLFFFLLLFCRNLLLFLNLLNSFFCAIFIKDKFVEALSKNSLIALLLSDWTKKWFLWSNLPLLLFSFILVTISIWNLTWFVSLMINEFLKIDSFLFNIGTWLNSFVSYPPSPFLASWLLEWLVASTLLSWQRS